MSNLRWRWASFDISDELKTYENIRFWLQEAKSQLENALKDAQATASKAVAEATTLRSEKSSAESALQVLLPLRYFFVRLFMDVTIRVDCY